MSSLYHECAQKETYTQTYSANSVEQFISKWTNYFSESNKPCIPFGRAHPYALIPSKGLPSGLEWELWRVEGYRGPNNCFLKCPSASLYGGAVIMQRISAKDHGGPKCPSVARFEILYSEGPFEVANSEHFSLERHFNMAAMIVFTPKCPSEGNISCLERTERPHVWFRRIVLSETILDSLNCYKNHHFK